DVYKRQRLGRRGDAAMADVLRLVGRVASGTLVVVGVITALDTLGLKVNAIIAGLGLSGFAIGLATRDALTNVLSGLLIIVYRPFERGDRVMVTGIEGVVEAVDLRYTTLRAEDRSVLIPNSTMLNSTVVIVRKGRMAPGSDGGVKE
ncbi:MAG: mechanosensitive ion channel family protein, partial [bacterium]|nr:mechanosensitive ion channel family protein [bacterium]